MRANPLNLLTLLLLLPAAIMVCGCHKTETFQTAALSDYLPLSVGKYITYRLDSTVFTSFGTNVEVHSYQEKNVVDAQVPDAMGRNSYRIYRYLRDTTNNEPWRPAGSYWITPLTKTTEVIENNLRFVKLAEPLKKDFTWKGNRYLPSDPYSAQFSFTNDNFETLADWDYSYTETAGTIVLNGKSYKDVLEVLIRNETTEPDTVDVMNSKAQIPAGSRNVYVRGAAADTIQAIVPKPSVTGFTLSICNRSNWPVNLNKIVTPVGFSRTYEWNNNQWTFGGGKDTLYASLPFAFKNYAVDKYARGLGLIYQELVMWDYQPPNVNNPVGGKTGFGIRRSLIDHN